MSGIQAAGKQPAQLPGQMFQPPKQCLSFASSRPPFVLLDEHHRLSAVGRSGADLADALVIKTPVSFWFEFLMGPCSHGVPGRCS
ncbi:hypothetical protein B296_00028016 [Ensete ventricosum]|uniref:Uncharacterized protein n=1 Tax=Ensete ventricosum TaxID=4639 RepID=A0A426Z686_ENSVE|nr:hypothetical protein B296_00028016 [Ensete ventricosum]